MIHEFKSSVKAIAAGVFVYLIGHMFAGSMASVMTGYFITSHDLSDASEVASVSKLLPVVSMAFDIMSGFAAGYICAFSAGKNEILHSTLAGMIILGSSMLPLLLVNPAGFSIFDYWLQMIVCFSASIGGAMRYFAKKRALNAISGRGNL
ncbi:MAG: hypothetical protein MUE70_11175 [Desulfobacterales bacterium]|jgi:hypothetical protein|nr:hypothetical protein [Desulfobacterales bacterium]